MKEYTGYTPVAKSNSIPPAAMTPEEVQEAEKRIRIAGNVGVFIAVVTFLFALVGHFSEDIRLRLGTDLWSLIDFILIAALSWGIFRQKRLAALGLLIYYTFNIISGFVDGNFGVRTLVGFFILWVLFRGTQAAFRLHKHRILTDGGKETRTKKKTLFYVAASIGGFIAFIFIGLALLGIITPETEVIPGRQLKAKYVNFVREHRLLGPSETIEFWYSNGFPSFENGFYFFTNKKVVLYNEDWEEPVIEVKLHEILDIEYYENPSVLEDGYVQIQLMDNSTVIFPLSSENDGDQKFIKRLKELWLLSEIPVSEN